MTTSARTAAASRGGPFDFFLPVWRMLTSVRFAVFFITLLALFALVGVIVPQVPEAMRGNNAAIAVWLDQERGMFGPLTMPMYRLGLFEVFRARWFLVALGVLVLNVSVCTVNRWSPTFRNVFRPPVRVPETFYERAHNRATLPAVAPAALAGALRRMRFRTRTELRDSAAYVFADRYPWAQLATFVSHLALVLFIAGGIVTWATGFSANLFAATGTVEPVFPVSNPNQLQVRVDDAIGRFGPNGNPIDFRTRLTIFKNGKEVASGTTTVNNPLKYGGYRFHQVSFSPDGAELKIRDVSTGNTVFHETIAMQNSVVAPVVTISDGADNVLYSGQVVPIDFADTASGAVVSVPGTQRAVWIGVTPKGQNAWQALVYDPSASGQLRLDPGGAGTLGGLSVRFDRIAAIPAATGVGIPGSTGQLIAQLVRGGAQDALVITGQDRPALALAPDQPVVFNGYEYTFLGARTFAGIQVKRDNGAWFIWVATAMLIGGLAITFYVPRRRLWIKVDGSGTHVAALAEKRGGFERDMRILARRLDVAVPRELEEEP